MKDIIIRVESVKFFLPLNLNGQSPSISILSDHHTKDKKKWRWVPFVYIRVVSKTNQFPVIRHFFLTKKPVHGVVWVVVCTSPMFSLVIIMILLTTSQNRNLFSSSGISAGNSSATDSSNDAEISGSTENFPPWLFSIIFLTSLV